MKRLLFALPLLMLLATPILAAEPVPPPDPLADNLVQQWMAASTVQQNVRQAIAQILQERVQMQQAITTLRTKCGDRCQDPPPPQAPAAPTAPTPTTPPTEPAK